MSRQQEFVDEQGKKWITPAKVAEIWNKRAEQEYETKGRYTRWSVYQRRDSFIEGEKLLTPGGDLYLESAAWQKELRPHPTSRPDVTKNRKGKKKNEIFKLSEKSPETP